jgi:hypothetical protein
MPSSDTRAGMTHDQTESQSTGPTSREGKETSSRNATTHGLTCRTFFLIGDETQEEFDAHAERWRAAYRDIASPALESLIETLIFADWLQKRAYRRVLESENALAFAELNRETPEVIGEIFKRLQTMLRHKTTLENSFGRALRAVEAWRKSRLAEELTKARTEIIVQTVRSKERTSCAQSTPGGAAAPNSCHREAVSDPLLPTSFVHQCDPTLPNGLNISLSSPSRLMSSNVQNLA